MTILSLQNKRKRFSNQLAANNKSIDRTFFECFVPTSDEKQFLDQMLCTALLFNQKDERSRIK